MPVIADPNFAYMSCTLSFARAAHFRVVHLKSTRLLEEVTSISGTEVPAYDPVHK